MVLCSDHEPAVVALGKALQAYRKADTMLSYGPRRVSKSGGRRRTPIYRSLAQSVESHHEVKMTSEPTRLLLIVRHVGWLLTRFAVENDGMTPFRRLCGRDYGGSVSEICETVLYHKVGQIGAKLWSRCDEGLWLGKLSSSNEHLIGTPEAWALARSGSVVLRTDGKRWSNRFFAQVMCTPWATKSGADDLSDQPRQRYLTKAALDKHGRTGVR